jgi:hypothetical protein
MLILECPYLWLGNPVPLEKKLIHTKSANYLGQREGVSVILLIWQFNIEYSINFLFLRTGSSVPVHCLSLPWPARSSNFVPILPAPPPEEEEGTR